MNELTNTSATGDLVKIKYGQSEALGELKAYQRDIFLFDTHVAGTSHIEGIEELEPHIQVGDRLDFFREPDNVADSMAIMIKNTDGIKIGYVPRKDNVVFARLMDAGKLLFGKVTSKELSGGWVKIYMDIFLQE